MPTYDYKCKACGHRYELFQSMTAKPIRKCPACGKNTAERLIGIGAAVLFKGSGFYQTDYRSDSYKKAAEADNKSSTPSTDKTADAAKPAETSKSSDAAKPAEAAKPAPETPKPAKSEPSSAAAKRNRKSTKPR